MELPTYTSVFTLERRLYAIYDLELPAPIALFQAAAFVAAAAVFLLVGRVLGVPLSAGTAWFYVVPPGFAAWIASKPVAESKRPHAWALSQLRHLVEPRVLHRLAPAREPEAVRLVAAVSAGRRHET